MHDVPLIFFTLFAQMAVGAFLWATIAGFKKEADFKNNTLSALIFMALGMLASLLHLGKPLLAITSLNHLFGSWLSREIFFSGGFFVLLLVFFYIERSGKAHGLRKPLAVVTSLAGLVAVFAMGKSYMTTMFPVWQSWNTMIDFYATALIMGGALFLVTSGKNEAVKGLRLDLVMLAVVLIQLALVPSLVASIGVSSVAGEASVAMLTGTYGFSLFLRWALVLAGIFMVLITRSGKLANSANVLYLAYAFLFAGMAVGRYLFYATAVATGIGIA